MQLWENNPYITKLDWEKQEFKHELPLPIERVKAQTTLGQFTYANGLWHHDDDDTKVILDNDPLDKKENRQKWLIKKDPDLQVIYCNYGLINSSNTTPLHYLHGFTKELEDKLPWWNHGNNYKIPITEFRGDIHLSDQEKSWISQVEEQGFKGNFWIVMGGGKYDFTTKWWDPRRYQDIIDYFKGRIQFVQCGSENDWHIPLRDVIDLRGKTDIRQFVRLVHHADGVLCPVTFAMHLAAAVPTKEGKPKHRACVVIAGSREPSHWEAYTHHQYIHNCGSLVCAPEGGCWKSRCQPVGDGDKKDNKEELCSWPVEIFGKFRIPKCMHMITTETVIRRIETYYEGGLYKYNQRSKIKV